ncbi:MAG: chemotaxis protein CheX [Thermodesulfobacteriota bacterium]
MRFDYINAFVEATAEVLNEMLGDKVERSRPALHGGITPKGGVIAALSLTGDVLGDVVFDMDEDTALKIAGRMNEEEFTRTEPVVLDSIGELMNIIVGKSITILNDKGYKFYLTPPVISDGKKLNLTFASTETLVVKVTTIFGVITVNVALAPEI